MQQKLLIQNPRPPPIPHEIRNLEGFLSIQNINKHCFFGIFRQRTNEESQSQIGPKFTQFPPKIILFQIQKYKNNVFIKHSTATSIFQAEKVVELGLLSLVCTFHTKILPARLTVKDIAGYSLSPYTLKIQCRTYNKIIITFIILDNLIL